VCLAVGIEYNTPSLSFGLPVFPPLSFSLLSPHECQHIGTALLVLCVNIETQPASQPARTYQRCRFPTTATRGSSVTTPKAPSGVWWRPPSPGGCGHTL